MLCITMKIEPRIAKQYKCHYCCVCKNYREKTMKDGKKKCLLHHFLADKKIGSVDKILWGASCSMNSKFLLVARCTLTWGGIL